jgi:hypothetical protein
MLTTLLVVMGWHIGVGVVFAMVMFVSRAPQKSVDDHTRNVRKMATYLDIFFMMVLLWPALMVFVLFGDIRKQ